MASRLVKRTLEIIGSETKTKMKDYTSNLTAFTRDAREVKDILIKGETNAADSYQKLKKTGITKRIADWFYGEESDFDSSTSDDFDPGFSSNSSDDSHPLDGDKKQTNLTYDAMKDISSKQTGMMLKIGRRQTEQSVANTAEIISVVNNRTAEMITSMNNINTTLRGVNERLDKLIKLQSFGIEVADENSSTEGGLYKDGQLSLMNVFNASRNAVSSGMVGQMLSMAKEGIGPDQLFGLALDHVLGKPLNSLGGKSVNELGKKFNEIIGDGISAALTSAIQSGPFKRFIGDITSFEGNKDFGQLNVAKYDTKRAQFDNMTRHSIVKIMPELLIKLNENLSGKSYHINQNGEVVEGPAANHFQSTINSSLNSVGTGLTGSAMNRISAGMNKVFTQQIPQDDINKAADALVKQFIFKQYAEGSFSVTRQTLRGDNTTIITNAVDLLGAINTDGRKGPDYWAKVCQIILSQMSEGILDANAFISNINKGLNSMQNSAIDHAKNSYYASQATQITQPMIKNAFIEQYKPTSGMTDDQTNKAQITRASTTTFRDKYSSADYIRGMFNILNRGVNVKLIGKKSSGYKALTANDIMKDPFTGNTNNQNDQSSQILTQMFTANTTDVGNSIEDVLNVLGGGGVTSNSVLGKTVNAAKGFLATGSNITNIANNLRSNAMMTELRQALHGDASALKARAGTGFNKAKAAATEMLPYGLTHDQRAINAANRAQELGGGLWGRVKGFGSSMKDKIAGTGVGQAAYRHANNALYAYDDRVLKSAQGKLDNFSTAGLNAHDLEEYNDAMKAIERGDLDSAYYGLDNISDSKASSYLKSQIDKIDKINTRRTNVQGTPDIGAVRMAAPAKGTGTDSPMYKLVKGGFNVTTKILGALTKLAKSGLQDIYYGFGSAFQGMFGGRRKDIKTGQSSWHRGLIGDLTLGTAQLGYHYSSKIAKGAYNKITGAINDYREGDSDIYDEEQGRYLTRAELKARNRQAKDQEEVQIKDEYGRNITITRAELRERNRKKVVSANYEHYDADGNWHIKSQGVKEGSVVTRGDLADNPVKALGKTVLNVVGKLGVFGGALKKAIGAVTKFVSGLKTKVSNAFRKTSFGKGFLEGFDKARIAKNNKKLEQEEKSSFANQAIGKIMRAITGEDKSADSPLVKICDILDEIKTNTAPAVQEIANPTVNTEDNTATENGADATTGSARGMQFTANSSSGDVANNQSSYTQQAEQEQPKQGGIMGKIKGAVGAVKESAVGQAASGTLENIGKVVGGMSQGIMGILKVAVSVLTAMESFQAIKDLVSEIFTKGLKPLNSLFNRVYKMLRPIVKQLTAIVREIAKALSDMLEGVLKTLTPLLKMISDAISTIFDTILKPVMEILDATLSACMVPITLAIDAMKPALDIICNDLKIVSGVVQLGMGAVMGLLGGIGSGIGALVSGVGKILRKLGLKSAGNSLIDTGAAVSEAAANMLDNSKTLIKNGAQQFKDGLAGQLQVVKKLVTLEYLKNDEEEENKTVVDQERLNNVNLEGENFGSGDVNTYNTWNYTYGSGNTMNQHTYGATMNMSDRGCGPVALADAYNRRNGSGMNPLTLASAMMGSGTYEPNRGTSVNGMLSTGSALGMNMRAAGVTQRSLNSATPSNPITVLGSGAGFGTKRGNDHYLNVLGSDGRGNSYVSNPMNGRVSRTPTSQLALNSRLGLYGSGDALPDEFGIDDESMTALERLKKLSERFTKIFTGDSTTDKIKKQVEAGKAENLTSTLDSQLGDISEEDLKQIEADARNLALKAFGEKRDGETQEQYDARFEKWYKDKQTDYLNQAKQAYIAKKMEEQKDSIDGSAWTKKYDDFKSVLDKMVKTAYDKSGLDGDDDGSVNSWTGAIMSKFSPLRNKTTNITNGAKDSKSPVHDYFAATSTGVFSDDNSSYNTDEYEHLFTYSGGWYNKGATPNTEGEGSSGNDNEGIVMRYDWFRANPTIRAITPGTVVYVSKNGGLAGDDPNGGYGNSVKWRDAAGMYHWYMGLDSIAKGIDVGANISENQEVGNMGHTGILDAIGMNAYDNYLKNGKTAEYEKKLGTMFRYIVTKTGGSQVGEQVNPLTYWQYEESDDADPANLQGNDVEEKVFNYLVDFFGGNKYAAAAAVGVMNNEGLANVNAPATMEGLFTENSNIGSSYGDIEGVHNYTTNILGINGGGYDSNGKNLCGLGIAQWTGPRARNLINFANQRGTKWTDLSTQLAFFNEEGKSSYAGTVNEMKGVTDVIDGANIWMTQYEGGKSGKDPVAAGVLNAERIAARRASAQAAYDKYANKSDSNPAGIDAYGKELKYRFKSTMVNSGDGDASDFIKAVAMAFRGYVTAHPAAAYSNYDVGSVTAPDGYTWDHFRPDCSGFMAAGMRKLGYKFSGSYNDVTGPLTFDFLGNEGRGLPEHGLDVFGEGKNDWVLMDFNRDIVQPGDILIKHGEKDDHEAMYLSLNKGLDGGSDNGIPRSASAYEDVMSGNYTSDKLAYTMPDEWNPLRILRYVGGKRNEPEENMSVPYLKSASNYQDMLDYSLASQVVRTNQNNRKNADEEKQEGAASKLVKALKDALQKESQYKTALDEFDNMSYFELQQYFNSMGKDVKASDYKGSWFDDNSGTSLKKLLLGKWPEIMSGAYDLGVEAADKNTASNYENTKLFKQIGNGIRNMMGSGDISADNTLPPIDLNNITDYAGQLQDSANGITQVFNISRDDSGSVKMLEALSKMTFNVRNERVEKLLEELVEYVKTKKKSQNTSVTRSNSNYESIEDLFEDEIPAAVKRLAQG